MFWVSVYVRILAPTITVRGLLKRPTSWAVGARYHLFFQASGGGGGPTLIESRVPAIPSVIPAPTLLCASLAPEFHKQILPSFPVAVGNLYHDPPVCSLG